MSTKRNPQDSTLRNVRASRKRMDALTGYVKVNERGIEWLLKEVAKLRKELHQLRPRVELIESRLGRVPKTFYTDAQLRAMRQREMSK